MIGFVLFDNRDDILYFFSDREFAVKLKNVGDVMGVNGEDLYDAEYIEDGSSENHLSPLILMQLFSPLLASYRIMNYQFHNTYQSIVCEDGTSVAFHEEMDFLLIAVGKNEISAYHLVKSFVDILKRVCGTSFNL